MSFAAEFKSALQGNAALSALVADRIQPVKLDKGTELPAVVYTVVSNVAQNVLNGDAPGLRILRVQVDSYATGYDAAHAIADAVMAALPANGASLKCLEIDRNDLFEEQRRLHRVSQDFSVHWTVS